MILTRTLILLVGLLTIIIELLLILRAILDNKHKPKRLASLNLSVAAVAK